MTCPHRADVTERKEYAMLTVSIPAPSGYHRQAAVSADAPDTMSVVITERKHRRARVHRTLAVVRIARTERDDVLALVEAVDVLDGLDGDLMRVTADAIASRLRLSVA